MSPSAVGPRLRAARLAQRRSLETVAASAGLTKGFLSRLERDQAGASVAALVRLCDSLGIAVGSLFEVPANGTLVRRDEAPSIRFGGSGLRECLLTPSQERRLQVIHSVIEPGGGSGAEAYALPSDVELAYVLEGELEIRFDTKATAEDDPTGTVRLSPGDAFTFSPRTPHTFRSLREDGSTQVLWVLAPALPDTEERPR